jgi:1,2-phenylacetyl-CoA epoxidase catalytic subunit
MAQATAEVPDDMRREYINWFTYMYEAELIGTDVAGYWTHKIPLRGPTSKKVIHKLGKMAYDEVRHGDIGKRMLQHFGGDEAVEAAHQKYAERGNDSYRHRFSRILMYGPDDWIEFLTTGPLLGDAPGIDIFADMAECSPDPLWSDAAESIAEDEKLHGSISEEPIPLVVEEYGDEAIESLERGLDRWMPLMFAHQGKPNSSTRQRMIDSGIMTMTVEDVHDIMYEILHDVFDPLEIEFSRIPDDEYLSQREGLEYGENILREKYSEEFLQESGVF